MTGLLNSLPTFDNWVQRADGNEHSLVRPDNVRDYVNVLFLDITSTLLNMLGKEMFQSLIGNEARIKKILVVYGTEPIFVYHMNPIRSPMIS